MISADLITWQKANKYRSDDGIVYGVHQGCGFTVSEEDGGKLFIFMLNAKSDKSFDALADAFASGNHEFADGQVGDVENYLAIFFDESEGATPAYVMDDLVSFVAENSKKFGFVTPSVCVKCGKPATKRSFVDKMVQPLCAECSQRNKQERSAKKQQQAESASAAYGAVGAQDYIYQNAVDNNLYDESYDEYAGMVPSGANGAGYEGGYETDESYAAYDAPQGNYADDYEEIMGEQGYDETPSEVARGGSMSHGLLGALVGSLIGIIIYIIVAVAASFPMGALCCPAGMLAVVLYTVLGGVKSTGIGVTVSAAVSSVVSTITVFFTTVLSYTGSGTNFSAALEYIFDDSMQALLLYINIGMAILGCVFGSLLLIGVMDKYTSPAEAQTDEQSDDNSDDYPDSYSDGYESGGYESDGYENYSN